MLRIRIRSTAYLRKWIVLGAVIGVISGLGAALFFVVLDFASQAFLGVAVPRGNVVLEAGDHLTVFTAPAAREGVHTLLASRIATEVEAS
jgi:bacteriorhodopsin